jgi:hypothetical protein
MILFQKYLRRFGPLTKMTPTAEQDHSNKVWLQLAQWFLKRRLKCEMLTEEK